MRTIVHWIATSVLHRTAYCKHRMLCPCTLHVEPCMCKGTRQGAGGLWLPLGRLPLRRLGSELKLAPQLARRSLCFSWCPSFPTTDMLRALPVGLRLKANESSPEKASSWGCRQWSAVGGGGRMVPPSRTSPCPCSRVVSPGPAPSWMASR